MRNYLLLSLLCIVFCYCFALVKSQKIVCNRNNEKHIDGLLARVITFGDSGRTFPETKEEVPGFCNETKALVKNVESYIKKCTKSLSKQLFSVYIFTIKSQLNQLCKKDSKRRQEMLESSKCVNSAKQAFAQCVDRTIDHLQRIKLVDDNKKIPHLCCEYHDNKACNAEGARKSGQCTEENLEAIDRFVDSVAGNSLNLLCGDFQEVTDKCKNIGKLPQNVKNPKKYKSFFIPAIEVISSLPQ